MPGTGDHTLSNALASLWAWAWIAAILVVGFLVELALFAVTRPFDPLLRAPGRCWRLMNVLAARLNPLWSFRVDERGGPPPAPSRPTVVVVNHASMSDVLLLAHLPWEMKWLGKQANFQIPFAGWCMWLAGHVAVRRGDRASGEAAMAACARWLGSGVPVLIFPEGTRSEDGALQELKDGAFRLAIDAGADMLPCWIEGTRAALPKGTWLFGRARATVSVGRALGSAGRTVEALKAEVRTELLRLRAAAGGAGTR